MPKYTSADIRNIALIGHAGAGKTSLAEAILHKSGVTNRLGSVDEKTSHLDYSEEEKEKGCSFDSAVCHCDFNGHRYNIIDTPGLLGFVGPAVAALDAVEMAVCVISAKDGIQVNTRKMMERAKEQGLARMIVINKIDADNINLEELVEQIHESFGNECVCVNLPRGGGKEIVDTFENETGDADFSDVATKHEKVIEAIVGVDDELMEQYLEGELDKSRLPEACRTATKEGLLVPIVFTDARDGIGIEELMHELEHFCPMPADGVKREIVNGDERTEVQVDPNAPFVGLVFKIMGDPKSNIKYSVIRCMQGTIKSDGLIYTDHDKKGLKPGHLHSIQGAEHTEVDSGIPGDIIAVAKLDLHIGQTVYAEPVGNIQTSRYPVPMFAMAIEPESRGDGDKISAALTRFTEEDPCFNSDRDPQTGELIIHGMGNLHLQTILGKMERYYKLKVITHPPRIPYRETITSPVSDVEYTHKKQSGGAGQYGKVVINVEPNPRGEGYEFVDQIFGGSIDQQFRPSVDKGIRTQMSEGVLAGYPVVDVKVALIDGKTHPVDSKDVAFQIAGRNAFKDAFMKAKPILLEPVVNMEVTIPADNVGDIQGDLASRRGRPIGQDVLPGGLVAIKAQVPLAEVSNYSSQLSSITGGQGSYTMELSHYDPVPGNVAQQVIDESKKRQEQAAAS